MTRTTTYTEPTANRSLTEYDDRTVAGLLLFVLGAGFMTALMLAAALVPGYDFRGGVISDLGVFSESALLFNGGLLVVGVLNLAGGYLLYRRHGKTWLLAIYALASVGAVGTGLFPLNTGDAHSLFALLAFLFFNLEAIGTATLLRGAMRALSVLAGVLGIVFLVLMAVGDGGNTAAFGPIGHGGTERMIVYPVMLWLVAFGGSLLGGGAVGE
ncbi:DUF998 domain-containing protein [Haloarchaeobius litoreus]|uniref:DUF998 domain-containing protein n=1 Tax=Haloarchaeobius litoreus TaxID=755306 RepID=A0ABD6DNY5_9EURY|nr:DUF998 domain-containing protein [Haloarchaeobius litoreus]